MTKQSVSAAKVLVAVPASRGLRRVFRGRLTKSSILRSLLRSLLLLSLNSLLQYSPEYLI